MKERVGVGAGGGALGLLHFGLWFYLCRQEMDLRLTQGSLGLGESPEQLCKQTEESEDLFLLHSPRTRNDLSDWAY